MQVRVTAPLKAQLQAAHPAAEATLVKKFTEWKSGPPNGHYWFSREVRGDDGHLYHAHLIPQNVVQDRVQWDALWSGRPRRPWLRRSDRYLLYADSGKLYGYLLIAVLDDPGAHTLWTPSAKVMRESFEIVAENFVYFGHVP
jgi:hypothetical protein